MSVDVRTALAFTLGSLKAGYAPPHSGGSMTSGFTELVVDCHDPERLAAFWCAVLGFRVIDRSEGKVEIGCREPASCWPAPPRA